MDTFGLVFVAVAGMLLFTLVVLAIGHDKAWKLQTRLTELERKNATLQTMCDVVTSHDSWGRTMSRWEWDQIEKAWDRIEKMGGARPNNPYSTNNFVISTNVPPEFASEILRHAQNLHVETGED